MSVQEVFLVKKGGTAESKTFRPFTKGWKVFLFYYVELDVKAV